MKTTNTREKQKEIPTSVKEKINSVLNPSIPEDYDPNLTEADIFNSLGITEEEYYNSLHPIQTMICTLKDHWTAVLSIITL